MSAVDLIADTTTERMLPKASCAPIGLLATNVMWRLLGRHFPEQNFETLVDLRTLGLQRPANRIRLTGLALQRHHGGGEFVTGLTQCDVHIRGEALNRFLSACPVQYITTLLNGAATPVHKRTITLRDLIFG